MVIATQSFGIWQDGVELGWVVSVIVRLGVGDGVKVGSPGLGVSIERVGE